MPYEFCRPRWRLLFLFLVFGLWVVAVDTDPLSGAEPGRERASPRFNPFDRDERAVYQASWNGIPVASAVIHAAPTMMEGKKFYRVQIQARSWRYLDLIWRMQDTIESLFDMETLHPRRFIFRQRENRKRIDTTALFDPGTNKWVVHRQQGTKLKEYEFISSETFDPISATYLARSLNFAVGDTLVMKVFGGKSRYEVFLDIAARERVSLKRGDVEAYKIIPRVRNLTSSGYATRMREATVWLSADDQKTLLKLTSQVFIGSVSIELVERIQQTMMF